MSVGSELDLGRELAAARERLAALAERAARVRARLAEARAGGKGVAPAAAPAPFGGADARPIDDLELTFRAVDGGEGAPDLDKAR